MILKRKKHNSYIIYHLITVNGNWGTWTSYGACSVTCGVGTQQRTRSCDNPAPSGGGTTCPGDALEARTCFDVTCYPSILGSLERVCNTMERFIKKPRIHTCINTCKYTGPRSTLGAYANRCYSTHKY